MQINPNIAPDSAASSVVKNRQAPAPGAPPSSSPQSYLPDFDLGRLQTLDGEGEIPDEAGADQALGFLRTSFAAQPGPALEAQGNVNPDSAYALLA